MSLPGSGPTHETMARAIWSVADLLRGDYKRHEYGKVILPFTVLRRLDAVMEPTREAVRARDESLPEIGNKRILLQKAAKLPFYNTSQFGFEKIAAEPTIVAKAVREYVNGFSENIKEILAQFDFDATVTRLANAKLLYRVVGRFGEMKDLDKLSSHDMGYVFEHLIRQFAEASNETAGEHFTPREVIQLMVKLLIAPDAAAVQDPGKVINVLDPACGTGGMLTAAQDQIKAINPDARVYLFGQELNGESWAICQSDMLMSTQGGTVAFGNSFSDDAHHRTFDYMLANPPFGVEWKKVKEAVEDEHELGHGGRFGAGLPRINDGSFLFLQHMLSKMEPAEKGGSRLAIVFNGSPLFTGAAESGESKIRQWILEMDYLEGIVGLPDQLFYNTGISTYFWILSNRKRPALKDKVVLLDARDQWEKMRKSLGDKRKEISGPQIDHITEVYAHALDIAADPEHADHAKVKVFRTRDFGYHRITVERPLKQRFEITDDTLAALGNARTLSRWDGRDVMVEALRSLNGSTWWTKREAADALRVAAAGAGGYWPTTASVVKGIWGAVGVSDPEGEVQKAKGEVLPDPDLRDYENIPLDEDIDEYFAREVTPHVPDAWIDRDKTKVGYEIPFTRYFYIYAPPRPLEEIDAELRQLEDRIQKLLGEVTSR